MARLIDADKANLQDIECGWGCDTNLWAVEDWFKSLPTVDAVEVVHGHWAALDDDYEELEGEDEAMRWGCSACHEVVDYDDWTHRSWLTRFCPNCGAKMDGERKDK